MVLESDILFMLRDAQKYSLQTTTPIFRKVALTQLCWFERWTDFQEDYRL